MVDRWDMSARLALPQVQMQARSWQADTMSEATIASEFIKLDMRRRLKAHHPYAARISSGTLPMRVTLNRCRV